MFKNRSFSLILILLFSVQGIASESTIYDYNNGSGNYRDIYGESILVDHFAINYGLPYNLGDKVSSVNTRSGYCTILAEHPYFNGRWGAMDGGLKNVSDQHFSYLNNRASSIGVYKKIREGNTACSTHNDIPILYEQSTFIDYGRKFPLIDNGRINSLGRTTIEFSNVLCSVDYDPGLNVSADNSIFDPLTETWSDPTFSISYIEGASVSSQCIGDAQLRPRDMQEAASYLRVPDCYTVWLYRTVEVDIWPYGTTSRLVRDVYGPGEYNFTGTNKDNSYWYYRSNRINSCTQPAFPSNPPNNDPPTTSCGAPSEAYCH